MARLVKPLTVTQIQNAKPKEVMYKMFDGGGLFLQVTPAGGKHWKMKYLKEGGKEGLLTFGAYPAVTLEQARKLRDEAKSRKAAGVDPGEARRREKRDRVRNAANTFEAVALAWLDVHATEVKPQTAHRIASLMKRLVFPAIGGVPVRDLRAPDFLDMLRRVEALGTLATVRKMTNTCSQVMCFAVATGQADMDPLPALRGSLKKRKRGHLAAITESKRLGWLLRKIHAYHGGFVVASALRMAPYVFVRPIELRYARWQDMDFESCEWRYTTGKTDTPHIVPFAPQVVDILRKLHPVTGHGEWVFPHHWGKTEKPMGNATLVSALRAMGIGAAEMSAHGFRAVARTLLDEVLGERYDFIEQQLAHTVRDPNGRAYNRTVHLAERKRMMCRWADYLDGLRDTVEEEKIEEDKAERNVPEAPAV